MMISIMYCILGPRMQYVMDIIMAGLYPVNMDMGVLVICMGHMDCVPKYFMKAGTRTKNTQRMLYFWKTDVSRISNMAFPHKFSTKKIPHRQTISTKSCPPKSSHLYNDELAQFTLSSSSQKSVFSTGQCNIVRGAHAKERELRM